MKVIRFGIIGPGLMGREFASACARWCHLTGINVRPEIVAVCGRDSSRYTWYRDNFPTIKQFTPDYRELLANPDVDAVYCAVPHNLHEEFYCAVIRSGKHLFGEKPFGIDKKANENICKCIAEHPEVFVRCCSEFPYYPPMQKIGKLLETDFFGKIIEVNSGFLHSSDLNPDKVINWKRMIEFNGEYGCMGDLGMHACHFPFRAGFIPKNVRAILSNLVPDRPDKSGSRVPCETWDNATLLCEAEDPRFGHAFPLTIKTQRIAPGETDTWYFEVKGMRGCAKWTSKNPRRLEVLEYTPGGTQALQQIDMGYESTFPTLTGGIFEFGFTDAILQMWAAFLSELAGELPAGKFVPCVTPEETTLSHKLFTAALESWKQGTTVSLD